MRENFANSAARDGLRPDESQLWNPPEHLAVNTDYSLQTAEKDKDEDKVEGERVNVTGSGKVTQEKKGDKRTSLTVASAITLAPPRALFSSFPRSVGRDAQPTVCSVYQLRLMKIIALVLKPTSYSNATN